MINHLTFTPTTLIPDKHHFDLYYIVAYVIIILSNEPNATYGYYLKIMAKTKPPTVHLYGFIILLLFVF